MFEIGRKIVSPYPTKKQNSYTLSPEKPNLYNLTQVTERVTLICTCLHKNEANILHLGCQCFSAVLIKNGFLPFFYLLSRN